MAERNVQLDDLRKGLPYLSSGPVASILNIISPGSSERLHSLFTSLLSDEATSCEKRAQGVASSSGERKGDPFPALD